MAYVKTARDAWRELPLGVTHNFRGKRIVKDRKMLLVMPTHAELEEILYRHLHSLGLVTHSGVIVAFPAAKHFREFQQAAEGVRVRGPASVNPGAVGTLSFMLKSTGGTNPQAGIEVFYAQSHFKTTGDLPLSRTLATHYGGWRQRAWSEILQLASKHGLKVVLPSRGTMANPALNEVVALSNRMGFKFIPGDPFNLYSQATLRPASFKDDFDKHGD